MTDIFDRPEAAQEQPRLNPLRQEIRQSLLSMGFKFMVTTGFLPTVREWRNALVWNGDLEREDRIALQRAMALLFSGFKAAYAKAELDIPHWLSKEFEESHE